MKDHLLSTLEPGKYFSMPTYLDENYILTAPEVPITQLLLDRLAKWEFDYIYSEGSTTDKKEIENDIASEVVPPSVLDGQHKENTLFLQSQDTFRTMADFTEKLFTAFVTKNELSLRDVSSRVRDLIEFIRDQKTYIIRITELEYPGKNYLVLHSVKSAILGIALGHALRLPNHRLIELGSALLLHEIGMVKLPPKLYISEKKLNPEERKAISAHTLLGFKILKSNDYPMSVCMAILESHENIDGSGYPRGLTGDKISLYGKIIAVCSSYVAMISERPYRGALDGHNALLELLKNKGRRYDELILRALIQIISLYPIGTYVELVNGSQGLVVQTNGDNPRVPFVKLVKSANGEFYADPPVVDTSREGTSIKRPLSLSEVSILRKSIA